MEDQKISKAGKCRTENGGPNVTRWKMQDRKMQDQKSLGGICRTGKWRTKVSLGLKCRTRKCRTSALQTNGAQTIKRH